VATEETSGDYEGLLHCGTVNLLYSPAADDIIEALEYPNQIWHEDEFGRYRLFILSFHPVLNYVKYYHIGDL